MGSGVTGVGSGVTGVGSGVTGVGSGVTGVGSGVTGVGSGVTGVGSGVGVGAGVGTGVEFDQVIVTNWDVAEAPDLSWVTLTLSLSCPGSVDLILTDLVSSLLSSVQVSPSVEDCHWYWKLGDLSRVSVCGFTLRVTD